MNFWEMFLGLKLLILWTLIRQTVGFLPSEESTNGRSQPTHSSITHDAIYRAAADVISHGIDPGIKHHLWNVIEILREYLGKIFSKSCLIIWIFYPPKNNTFSQPEFENRKCVTAYTQLRPPSLYDIHLYLKQDKCFLS